MGSRGPQPRTVLTVGDAVGKLTIIAPQEGRTIRCRCSCGAEKDIRAADLRRARPIKSCGHRVPAPTLKPAQEFAPGLCRCCDREATSRGLCATCYSRASARGVLDDVALESSRTSWLSGPESAFWKGNTVDYEGAHTRIRRIRGRASDKPCAEPGCERQAQNWSYDGHCPQERVCPDRGAPYCYHYRDHYQPRCIRCHRQWDRDMEVVARH